MTFMSRLTLSLLAAASFFPALASSQTMVCSTDMVAGITFNRAAGRWEAGVGRPQAKYVLRRSDNTRLKYEVVQSGSKTAIGFCDKEFEGGTLKCWGFGSDFYFSKLDLRFLRTYTLGYWNESTINAISPGRKEGADTPSVEAGTCAAL